MEKTDTRTLKPEVQEQLRKQAIFLRQKGHRVQQIAAMLGVHPRTVYRSAADLADLGHADAHPHGGGVFETLGVHAPEAPAASR